MLSYTLLYHTLLYPTQALAVLYTVQKQLMLDRPFASFWMF